MPCYSRCSIEYISSYSSQSPAPMMRNSTRSSAVPTLRSSRACLAQISKPFCFHPVRYATSHVLCPYSFSRVANKPHLQAFLASIVHYTTTDEPFYHDMRLGFHVLTRLAQLWLPSIPSSTLTNGTTNGTHEAPIPDFAPFLYEKVVRTCFVLATQRRFDYSDAQTYQVCYILPLLQRRG